MHRSYATMFSTEQDIVSKCIVPMLQCFMQYDMTLSSTRTCTTRMTQWNDMTLLSVHALVVCHNGRNSTDMTLLSMRTCATRMTQWSEQNDMTLLSVYALFV